MATRRMNEGQQPAIGRVRIAAICLAAALPILSLQFLPRAKSINPPVARGQRIEENLQIPAPVSALLYQACGNCHSNLTKWPWYSHLAPMSWLIAGDVNAARDVMNFSDWAAGPGASADQAIPWLGLICADVQAGRMPPSRYLILHPEARLSPGATAALCDWTKLESARLTGRARQETAKIAGSSSPSQ